MRNITLSNYPSRGSGSYGLLLKGLLLSMAMVLFQFTGVHAQVNRDAEQVTIESNSYIEVDPIQAELGYSNRSGAAFARSNVFVEENPDVDPSVNCANLRITLLLDESGSILTRDGVEQVRLATLALAEVLLGTPANLRIVEFENTAREIELSDPNALQYVVTQTYIDNLTEYLYNDYNGQSYDPNSEGLSLPCPVGNTNWEAGLTTALDTDPNLIIFLTDGEPTSFSTDQNSCGFIIGGGSAPIDEATLQANVIRGAENGVHIFAYGVGNGINSNNIQNLIDVSGPDQGGAGGNIFTDDYSTGSFEELADNLSAGVNSLCGTELALTKIVSTGEVCSDSQQITFTLSVLNTGGNTNIAATNVILEDEFPATFQNLSIVEPAPAGASINGQVLTYEIGYLAVDSSVTIQVTATIPGADGNFTNTATADASNALAVQAEASVEKADEFTSVIDIEECGSFEFDPSEYVVDPEVATIEVLAAGDYVRVVTGLTESGCPLEVTLNISVTEQELLPTLIVEDVCGTYEWDANDDGFYDPETEPSYSVSGTYEYALTNDFGLCALATLDLTVVPATEINEGVVTTCDDEYIVYLEDGTEIAVYDAGDNGLISDAINIGGFLCVTIDLYLNIGDVGAPCSVNGDGVNDGLIAVGINGDCFCEPGIPDPCVDAGGDADDDGICDDEDDCVGIVDDCGICREANDPDFNTTCLDCAGVVNGSSTLDACGVCDEIASNDNETCTDCAGVVNGSSTLDACGVCDEIASNDNETCTDCAGVVNGSSTLDACGVCDDIASNDNETCTDCAGVVNGSSTLDACGVCDDIASNDNETCTDCAGVVNGSSTLDACGVCDDIASNDNETCTDCAGVVNGSSTLDACGVCDDIASNDNETCTDCAGVVGGTAFLDDCEICVGGDTGLDACEFDCSEIQANFGDSCNDGNPNTIGDTITEECLCVGTPSNVDDDCTNFSTYFVGHGAGVDGSDIYKVSFAGGEAILNFEFNVSYPAHMAIDAQAGIAYLVNENGSGLEAYDLNGNASNGTLALAPGLSHVVAAVFNPNDGLVYIGDMDVKKIFTIDPNGTGQRVFYANAPVSGGDLAFQDGELYLATKTGNRLYKVVQNGSAVLIGTIPGGVNGLAASNNATDVIVSNLNSSQITQVTASNGSVQSTFDVVLNGEIFTIQNGDLASGCVSNNPIDEVCYGSDILEFNQGFQTNGNAVPADRSNATKALGEPDRSNAAGGFVSLGVGGSITIGFAGIVNDGPGNDIKIWETSFSGNTCGGSGDERAVIELSFDNANWTSVGTICLDGEIDLADFGLTSIRYIRITTAASTTTLDGYDVDGVEALNGCSNEPLIVYGDCYATESVEYIAGLRLNGNPLSAERTNASKALEAPERSDAMNFVSLGYGGSIILGFDGAVPNGSGNDLEIVETTYNFSSVAAYPEFADVYVSVNGDIWDYAGTVDYENRFIDISNAGTFDFINYVKIVNNNDLSNTDDGFDLDGVVALHNCEDIAPNRPIDAVAQSVLSTYPNPTSGFSKVVFTTAETASTLVEAYDMNGRNVGTLFNQEAQAGKEYTLDFNGNNLPNGVYIYRLTTNNETIIEKFMIAR